MSSDVRRGRAGSAFALPNIHEVVGEEVAARPLFAAAGDRRLRLPLVDDPVEQRRIDRYLDLARELGEQEWFMGVPPLGLFMRYNEGSQLQLLAHLERVADRERLWRRLPWPIREQVDLQEAERVAREMTTEDGREHRGLVERLLLGAGRGEDGQEGKLTMGELQDIVQAIREVERSAPERRQRYDEWFQGQLERVERERQEEEDREEMAALQKERRRRSRLKRMLDIRDVVDFNGERQLRSGELRRKLARQEAQRRRRLRRGLGIPSDVWDALRNQEGTRLRSGRVVV